MTEIKTLTKIVLLAYAIITFFYGFMNVFLADMFFFDVTGYTDPFHIRVFGGICFVSSVFAIIILRKKEWEGIKLTYSYLFVLFIPTIIINTTIFAISFPNLNAGSISLFVMGLIFMSILFTLGLISYLRQK